MASAEKLHENTDAQTVGTAHPAPPTTPTAAFEPSSQLSGDDGSAKPAAPKGGTPKGGAPALNSNRRRSGLYSRPDVIAVQLALGSLPKSMKRVESDVYNFRCLLEQTVIDTKGQIGLTDAALIQTACRHERASRLALAWLRDHESELTHAERLAYSKATADSSTARDKTIERLALDRDTSPAGILDAAFAAADAQLAAQHCAIGQSEHTTHQPADAANAAVERHNP